MTRGGISITQASNITFKALNLVKWRNVGQKTLVYFLGEEYLISEATPVITKMTELKWLIITDARMD